MYSSKTVIITSIIPILMLLLTACGFPSRQSPTAATTKGLPASILTEVSATLIANLPPTTVENIAPSPEATNTEQVVESSKSPTPQSVPENLLPTASLTKTRSPIPSSTFTPTFTSLPPSPTFTSTLAPSATATRVVTPGTHFVIDNINISNTCVGSLWVYITIYNNGTSTLESLSLSIYDDTEEKTLLIPKVNNNPFNPVDEICSPGNQDFLDSGKISFISASLNSTNLSKHTLSVTIKMCNGESLFPPCYQRIVNFIVP